MSIQPPQTAIPEPSSDDRTMAMLAHLLGFFGWIAPLIIWLVKRKQSAFLDYHAKEALNFQITFVITFLVVHLGMLLGWRPTSIREMVTQGTVMVVTMLLLLIGDLVAAIMGAVAADRGKTYWYPVAIRFIR